MPKTQIVSSALRGAMSKCRTASALRRATLLLGAIGMTGGAGLLAAGFALAATGSEPGNLVLTATTGALTSTPTWKTTDGCPTNFQVSAEISEFKLDGTLVSRISTAVNSSVTGPFGPALGGGPGGTLDGNVGALLGVGGVSPSAPGTVEWAVGCYAGTGAAGNVTFVQSVFVSVAAGATTYTTSSSAPSGTPSTSPSASASASPSPSASSSPSPSSSPSASPSPSSTPTDTTSVTPPPMTTVLPSGAPATGAGGAAVPGAPNDLLIALGAILFTGSAAATGVAIQRSRAVVMDGGRGDARAGGS